MCRTLYFDLKIRYCLHLPQHNLDARDVHLLAVFAFYDFRRDFDVLYLRVRHELVPHDFRDVDRVAYGFPARLQDYGVVIHVELHHAGEHVRHRRLLSDENDVVSRIVETHAAASLPLLSEWIILASQGNKDWRNFYLFFLF